MKCTAILVNYFNSNDISGAVQALLADCEGLDIIVVDNSCNIFEASQLRALLPMSVKVLTSIENLGFGAACNWAFSNSNTEFVFLVNPDVRILSGCIGNLMSYLRSNDGVAAVSPKQYLDDACDWMLPPSWFPTEIRAWVNELALRNRDVALKVSFASRNEAIRYWTAESPIAQRALSGGMLMIRRAALRDCGELFDSQFFMYFEDSDLCRRLKRRGYKLSMVPTAKGVHRWKNQPHKQELMVASSRKYFDKYAESGLHWRNKSVDCLKRELVACPLGISAVFPVHGVSLEPGKWLFEMSPSPLMSPAIGRIFVGNHVHFPHAVMENFEGAPVFARLGALTDTSAADNCRYFTLN